MRDFEDANNINLSPMQRAAFIYGMAAGLAYATNEIAENSVKLMDFSEENNE